jgi:hypothetical protein
VLFVIVLAPLRRHVGRAGVIRTMRWTSKVSPSGVVKRCWQRCTWPKRGIGFCPRGSNTIFATEYTACSRARSSVRVFEWPLPHRMRQLLFPAVGCYESDPGSSWCCDCAIGSEMTVALLRFAATAVQRLHEPDSAT